MRDLGYAPTRWLPLSATAAGAYSYCQGRYIYSCNYFPSGKALLHAMHPCGARAGGLLLLSGARGRADSCTCLKPFVKLKLAANGGIWATPCLNAPCRAAPVCRQRDWAVPCQHSSACHLKRRSIQQLLQAALPRAASVNNGGSGAAPGLPTHCPVSWRPPNATAGYASLIGLSTFPNDSCVCKVLLNCSALTFF